MKRKRFTEEQIIAVLKEHEVGAIYASFDRIYEAFFAIASVFSDADQRKLFHDNSERVYRL